MSARGLGRGFEALIPTENIDASFDPTADEDAKDSKLREIKTTEIEPDPEQPRREFKQDQLEALANSIRQHGGCSRLSSPKKVISIALSPENAVGVHLKLPALIRYLQLFVPSMLKNDSSYLLSRTSSVKI